MLQREIEDLTKEKQQIQEQLAAGNVQSQDIYKRIGELSLLLDQKELRWLELSELASD
jgi:ATP-binding cassette subfamily F protein uup